MIIHNLLWVRNVNTSNDFPILYYRKLNQSSTKISIDFVNRTLIY